MKIASMMETGMMLFIGIIALKAFGGVKGISSFIGDMGDLFGMGGSGGSGGGGGVVPPLDFSTLPPGSETNIIETEAVQPFNPWALLSPFATIGEMLRYGTQHPKQTIVNVNVPVTWTPSPSDVTIPHDEPVWVQSSDMVSDVLREGREGETWVGGR